MEHDRALISSIVTALVTLPGFNFSIQVSADVALRYENTEYPSVCFTCSRGGLSSPVDPEERWKVCYCRKKDTVCQWQVSERYEFILPEKHTPVSLLLSLWCFYSGGLQHEFLLLNPDLHFCYLSFQTASAKTGSLSQPRTLRWLEWIF